MLDRMTITRSSAPVREQVVRILQEAIADGYFSPGQRLVERELCELLGASRTTVREALRQLEAEGLVKVVPGKGVVAAAISPAEAVALYRVREVLEGLAGRLFAESASEEAIAKLDSTMDQLLATVDETPPDVKRVLAIKNQLYDVLFEGCGNPVLRSLTESIHARVTLLRSASLSYSYSERLPQMLAEMRAIIESIRRRDSAAAEQACAAHVRSAARAALLMLEHGEASGPARVPTAESA
jgi:DNA-binding GntR family transcriptional regulator